MTISKANFDEDEAEFQKLHETPSCFIVIGKPGSGKSSLAKNLAHYWKCKLVTPETAIEWALKQESDLGTEVLDRLTHGQAIPESLTLKIISQRISDLDIKHHGYVLDGVPVLDSEFMSTEEQLSVIKNFDLTPEFIINIKISDEDLVERRSKQLLFPPTNTLHSPDNIAPASSSQDEEGEEEGEEEEEEEEEGEEENVDPDAIPEQIYELIDSQVPAGALESMIRRPEDDPEAVRKEIETYFNNVLPSLEDYIIAHDRQKVIELNGLLSKKDLLNTLMTKLSTYCAYNAIQPIPLFPEDEEQDPDLEADDLLKMLVKKDTVGSRFPWRKSRWEANDPVALQQGSIQQGKFQYSVSYLGKVYCMSSEEHLQKFLENPRPYLLPPQPRIPAKICIIGPPSSGKSTLCKVLCEHYGSALLDMNVLAADVRDTEQQKHVAQVRDDAKVTFLNQIREQIQNAAQIVVESRARRAMMAADQADEAETEEPTEGGGDESEESRMVEKALQEKEEIDRENDLIKKFSFTFDDEGQIILPEITEDHPLVKEQVEKVTAEARNHDVEISPEMYCSVLEEAIRGVITGHQTKGEPDFGGWILDNFPLTRDQWTMMTERADKLLTPDSFIILNDPDPESGTLLRRWANDQTPPITLTPAQIKAVEKKKAKPSGDAKSGDSLAPLEEEEQEDTKDAVPTSVEQRVLFRKAFDREKPQLEAIIKQSDVEFLSIDCNVTEEDLKADAIHKLDAMFRYKAVEYFTYEEEDQEEEDEEEGEEEVDKRHLGETRHYCPVTLLEKNVLWPGDQEIGARYREKIYLFSSPDNKTKFMENPHKYAPSAAPLSPPPIRLCILGPKSSGKTEQGRALARKLGLFHISFHKYLEEIIIPKVKVRVWESDHEEEPPPSEEEEADDDEGDEETKEIKKAKEIASKMKSEDLDDSLLQTPSGMDYLVGQFASTTVDQFVKALEIRRALIAKQTGRKPDAEETLNEMEEAIQASLVEGESLPPEILEQIVVAWWTKNPFKDTGFILEGFPRTPQEATFMTDTGLFPDACIILEVEDENVGDRQLPRKLQKWKDKMAKKLARRQRHQERRRKKKEKEKKKKIQEKYEELVAERGVRLEERRKEKEEAAKFGEVNESDGEESEEEPEIDIKDVTISDEEDDDEEDDMGEEEDETEEEAVDRIRGEISDRYDNDIQLIAQLQNTLEDLNIPRMVIDASRKPKVVFYTLSQQLRSITDFRQSLFAQCHALRARQANDMLARGYKQSSKFGRWDPVLLEGGEAIQPYQAPGRLTYPVVYRAHIYFLSSLENRQKFMDNPLRYLKLPTPPPVVPVKLAIVGPPKCGKSMLARRLERDHGIVCLSAGEAVRQFMALFPTSSLTKEMETHLRAGVVLPDALVVEALEKIMLSQRCQTRGYVLDGYPNTIEQVQLLTESSIIPMQIIELTLSSKEVHWRGTSDRHSVDRTLPLHDSAPILDVRFSSYKRNIDVVRSHYQREHRNWHVLEGNRSKWWLNNECAKLINEQLRTAQGYLQKRSIGEAASIFGLCVTPNECTNRLGEFSYYCPVSLATNHELVDCSYETTMKYTAEYRARYYKMAGEKEFALFLADAHNYVSPTAPHFLPEQLPKYVSPGEVKQLFPKELSFRGYCPVTYVLGHKRYEALKPGSRDHVVMYDDELFSMLDENAMEIFLKQPWKFNKTPLPAKLPPAKVAQDVTSLPMLGYMEQTVAKAIIAAMTSCSDFKPKYPYVNAHKSALLYVGYHLKANNPNATDYSREKYRKKLEKFKEHCDLIKYLGGNMNRRYRPESERPIDFNYKMDEFLALKSYPLPIN